jgi:hypothetical protein
MSREIRLVVILVVIGVVGVFGLAMVAGKYRKALRDDAMTGAAKPEDPAARAVRLVGGFLAARERGEDRAARDSALDAYGMTHEDYASVLSAWRAWSMGEPLADPALAAAFAARRYALERVK